MKAIPSHICLFVKKVEKVRPDSFSISFARTVLEEARCGQSDAGRGRMKVWYRAMAPNMRDASARVRVQEKGTSPVFPSSTPAMKTRTPCPKMVASL